MPVSPKGSHSHTREFIRLLPNANMELTMYNNWQFMYLSFLL